MRKFTLFFLVVSAAPVCADPAMEGEWMLDVRPEGAPLTGLLQLERDGDQWKAYVEGGPAPVSVDGNRITVDIDSRDIRGFVFVIRLAGTYEDGRLSGDFTIESDATIRMTPGSWSATRYEPQTRPSEPDPVGLAGLWKPAPGVDFRKYTMDLTPAAQAWYEGYLMHYDQPNVRCVSTGITAMVAWGGYPFEILESEDRLTFLYEVESEVRRIYLDDRKPPEYFPHSGMGYSNGRWEGSALVITTTHLSPNVRDFRGEPVSENARLEEVYTLSEDGERLEAVRRRAWTRSPDTEIYPYECDPDSFYRQMYNEGRLDMYFERSKRRF